jgi:hypothetical protein
MYFAVLAEYSYIATACIQGAERWKKGVIIGEEQDFYKQA